MANEIAVKHTRVTSAKLNTVPVEDGQIIELSDKAGWYYDSGNTRYQLGQGHTIENPAGTDMTQRENMQFVDSHLADDSTNNRTKIETIKTVTSAQFDIATEDGLYNISDGTTSPLTASDVGYDNTSSGLAATDVQDAIDEVNSTASAKISDNPTFTEASTRANIASGESFATILGKIKKFFTDLKDLAFIAKDGSTSKYLRGDGTWQTFPTIPTDFVSKENGGTFNGNVVIDKHNGTVSDWGYGYLELGNNIPTGTAGNARGILSIYGTGSYYGWITALGLTQNRTLTLPDKDGTIAVTDDTSLAEYLIKGWLLTDNAGSNNTKIYGLGCVRILNKHYVEVHFSTKIETVSSSSTGYLRLNVQTLRNRNSNIPSGIIPTFGGICTIFDADGKYSALNDYGCCMGENTTEWEITRMYNTSGTISPYVPAAFSVGQRIVGTAYGYLP